MMSVHNETVSQVAAEVGTKLRKAVDQL